MLGQGLCRENENARREETKKMKIWILSRFSKTLEPFNDRLGVRKGLLFITVLLHIIYWSKKKTVQARVSLN